MSYVVEQGARNAATRGNRVKKDWFLAFLLAVIVVFIRLSAFPRFIRWDAADFLSMAEWFSGRTFYFFSRQAGPSMIDARPPALPVLVSIAFRVLGRSEFSAYLISGLLFGAGILGVYCLLSRFFSSKYSLLGAVLFALNPVVFEWAGQLYTHVEVTAFMVWTLYTFMKAIDGKRRWFLLAFPLLFMVVMTRYTGILITVPIAVYAIGTDRENALRIRNIKYGLITGLAMLVAISYQWFLHLYSKYGLFFFAKVLNFYLFRPIEKSNPFISSLGVAYYFVNLPSLLGPGKLGYLWLIILSLGILACKRKSRFDRTGWADSFILTMLSWLLAALGFYSIASYKKIRYGIEFLVPLIVVVLLGIQTIVQKRRATVGWRLVFASLCFVIAGNFILFPTNLTRTNVLVEDRTVSIETMETVRWINQYVLAQERVASNMWPHLAWRSKRYIYSAPAKYEIKNRKSLSLFFKKIEAEQISYVAYYGGGDAFNEMTEMKLVWQTKSGAMKVYKIQEEF